MRVQNLAEDLIPDAFEDAKKLITEPVTSEIAPQPYAAVVGIGANIAEAYSRTSGKERARDHPKRARQDHEVAHRQQFRTSLSPLGSQLVADHRL